MAPRKGQGGARPASVAPPAAPDAADQSAAAAVELAEVTADADLRRYPVLSPLRFDGTLYRPEDPERDEVTMTPDQAEPLQALTVLGAALG